MTQQFKCMVTASGVCVGVMLLRHTSRSKYTLPGTSQNNENNENNVNNENNERLGGTADNDTVVNLDILWEENSEIATGKSSSASTTGWLDGRILQFNLFRC